MTDWTPPVRQFLTVNAATLNAYWRDNIKYIAENLPHHVTLWHHTSIVTAGNAIAAVVTPTQYFYRTWKQSTSADANSFTQSFVCAAGTYDVYILCRKTNASGLVDWDLDGSSISTGMDFYNATTQVNQKLSITSVSITEPGRHVLTGTVNGQNAGSSSYDVEITKLWAVKQ